MPFKDKPNTYKALIRNFAKVSGKSVRMVDKMFQKAEDVVEKKLKIKKTDKKFYPIVVTILKNWLKIKNYKRPVESVVDRLLKEYLFEQFSGKGKVQYVKSIDMEDGYIERYKVYDEEGEVHDVEISYRFDFGEDEEPDYVSVEVIWDGTLDYSDSYRVGSMSAKNSIVRAMKKRYPELAKQLDRFLP